MGERDDLDEPAAATADEVRKAQIAMIAVLGGEVDEPPAVEPAPEPLTIAVWGNLQSKDRARVSANLTLALAKLDYRVCLVNPGIVPHEQREMFGFLKALDDSSAPLMETAVPQLFVSPGTTSALPANEDQEDRAIEIIKNVHRLRVDVVVLDCTEGTGFDTSDFFDLADHRLMVIDTAAAPLGRAYAFLKGSVHRVIRESLSSHAERTLLDDTIRASGGQKVREAVALLPSRAGAVRAKVESRLRGYSVSVVGYEVGGRAEQDKLHAFTRMLHDFLSLTVPVVPLPEDPKINENLASPAARPIFNLAKRLADADVEPLRPGSRTARAEGDDLPGALGSYLRRHRRFPVQWPAVLNAGGRQFDAVVADLSAGGALVECTAIVEEGHSVSLVVTVEHERTVLTATVRRALSGRLGIEFGRETNRRIVRALLAEARRRVPHEP
jgi:MinD-like ATPase involved in chromosome partitioning or flagellar assembly